MSLLFGDKQIFAIELASDEDLIGGVGRVLLWLGGEYVGTFDDTSIHSLVLAQLKSVFSKRLDGDYLRGEAVCQMYDLIKSEKIEGAGQYFLSLGDSFDDFSIVVFLKGEEVVFLWKLLDKPFFEYKNYPEGLQCSIIPAAFFSKVLSDFGSSRPLR
ncbi:hypothetical protein GCM10007860_27110 [Chitiniphilus shinanonensis]|uniref:Uncharacterized protein n=1 Tax=Chitiniphilus shinanonensis TaxID=553088 RepID=A0ABQ6BWK3_9NEIS|nr:hypothetical protein [Chitiniphilus shinanonensis]GLS05555.1 hypothetical protein GCM10007860_27110 [Chitiniphilus shinanonensis]